MATGFFSHESCQRHDMGAAHPESPARIAAIVDYLRATGVYSELSLRDAPLADRQDLLRAHPETHVEMLHQLSPAEGLAQVDPDTTMNPHTLEASMRAAGAVAAAVRAVLAGEMANAFCAVRPPGHHAERDAAMGFCFFNNVAVGAGVALAAGLTRVAILDFDVHHGNGTVDIFQDDERVMVCSSFQHPFYPGRLHDIDRPHIVNTPLAEGTRGLEFRRRVERDWLRALDAHRPQLLLVSAGFDAHADDPLGGLELQEPDYRWVTELITDVARRHAAGRVVAALEGGYDLNALARSADAHIQVLREADASR
jgi:acetoin utilization deacetylase AcuC-like enzyme